MTITTLETKFRGDRETLIPDYIRRNGHEVQELNTPGKLEWIDIEDITIPEYQRETDANWVKKSLTLNLTMQAKEAVALIGTALVVSQVAVIPKLVKLD